jgi:hypothetical protein
MAEPGVSRRCGSAMLPRLQKEHTKALISHGLVTFWSLALPSVSRSLINLGYIYSWERCERALAGMNEGGYEPLSVFPFAIVR